MMCFKCGNYDKCLDRLDTKEGKICGCTSGIPTHKKMTNADKIRAMSDEELANVFIQAGVDGCRKSCCQCIFNNENDDCVLDSGTTIEFILEWLQSEVKESEQNGKMAE